jgi:hypothetical protein
MEMYVGNDFKLPFPLGAEKHQLVWYTLMEKEKNIKILVYQFGNHYWVSSAHSSFIMLHYTYVKNGYRKIPVQVIFS